MRSSESYLHSAGGQREPAWVKAPIPWRHSESSCLSYFSSIVCRWTSELVHGHNLSEKPIHECFIHWYTNPKPSIHEYSWLTLLAVCWFHSYSRMSYRQRSTSTDCSWMLRCRACWSAAWMTSLRRQLRHLTVRRDSSQSGEANLKVFPQNYDADCHKGCQ